MKKLLIILIVIVVGAVLCVFFSNRTSVETSDNDEPTSEIYFHFSLYEDGNYGIRCRSDFNSLPKKIVIPSTYNDRPVTIIEFHAFYDCSNITSVIIPDSVTGIGNYAFKNCSSLTSVTIGSGVTSIGDYAFEDCGSITSINVDESNEYYKSIDGNLYSKDGKTLIKYAVGKDNAEFTIPSSVTSIGNHAFMYCRGLKSVTIPDSVTGIGNHAFTYCRGLKSLTIPDSVTSIDERTFHGCYNLTSVTIPDSVTSIEDYAFDQCTSIESLTCPALAISYIKKTNLQTVVITSGESIGNLAFSGCGVKSVTIGNSVTSIGESAFKGCSRLASITIGKGVTSIGKWAFKDCRSLASITIPDSVTSIGDDAFEYCSSLTSVTGPAFAISYIPKDNLQTAVITSGESIGNLALGGCGVKSVTIGNGVTSIGEWAFAGCSSLTSVTIPDSVTSIGEWAFYYCFSLTSINVSGGNANYKSIDGNLYSKDGKTLIQYATGKADAKFTIPTGVTSIGEGAFYGCRRLTSVIIPDSVTSIGNSVFSLCSSLTSVTIGKGVTNIETSAFTGCYKLVEIINKSALTITKGSGDNGYVGYYALTIHDGESKVVNKDSYLFITDSGTNYLLGYMGTKTKLTLPNDYNGEQYQICRRAFYECYSLTSVTIPDNVTSIGVAAFSYCNSLTSIYYTGTPSQWAQIDGLDNLMYSGRTLYINNEVLTEVVLENITKIKPYAFYNCSGLTSVTIPNGVTSIGSGAFSGCSSLTSVTIPNSVTSIGDRAFRDCSSLTSITIGNSVTSIGVAAFQSCSSLTSVTIPDSMTSIGEAAFYICSGLTSIIIPDSVTSIEWSAFRDCSSLTKVYYKGTAEEWSNISIDNQNGYNNKLINATRYYYSEEEPTASGNYWHYVGGIVTKW